MGTSESNHIVYVLDCSKALASQSLAFPQTVADKKEEYTKREYKQVLLARKLQNRLSYSSTSSFLKILDKNLLPNSPVSRTDVMNAEDIFGPNVGSLQGKTVEHRGAPVQVTMIPISPSLFTRCRIVTVCADVMKVNQIPFLMTISRKG